MKKYFVAAAVALLGSTAANSATVVINNGFITGASGVVSNGATYDVTFNNRCAEAYGSCSASGTFAFTDRASAATALEDLRSQVFTTTDSRLVNGCAAPTTASNCFFILGYLNRGTAAAVVNVFANTTDFFLADDDYGNATFVSFNAVAAAVPEPTTWAMMLVGFAMVGGAARYRRRISKVAYA